MRYQTDQWIVKRWETGTRYYVAEVCQDLFGCWVLQRRWGGLGTRLGGTLTTSAKDYTHALALLEDVATRRQSRGYTHV